MGIIPVIQSLDSACDYEDLIKEYSCLFSGLGKLKGTHVNFHIDESVTPVSQQPRRIPFHMRDKVEKELERLEQLDVIERVEDGPTSIN